MINRHLIVSFTLLETKLNKRIRLCVLKCNAYIQHTPPHNNNIKNNKVNLYIK